MNSSVWEKRGVMITAALFCCLLWGSAFPSIKLSYSALGITSESPRILLAGLRFCLAGVMVLGFVKLRLRTKLVPPRIERPLILLVAFLQTFCAYLVYYIGMAHTTAVKGSVIVSLNVFFVAVLAHFMFRADRLGFKQAIGLLCGFAGVIVANLTLLGSERFVFTVIGEGFIVLHCILCAIVTILIRKYARQMDMARLSGWQLFIGGVMLTAAGAAGSPQALVFNTQATLLLIYMAAISAVAFTVWFILLKYHSAPVLEQYKFSIPIAGSLLSVLFVPGEHIGPELLAAVVLVAAGIYIVNRQDMGAKSK